MSTPVTDIEVVLDEILAVLAANFNTKIAAINAEKNDAITLLTLASDAYFLQSLDEKTANFDPFILVQVQDIDSKTSMASYTQSKLSVVVAIMLEDAGQDSNVVRRVFRYGRALREVFEENFDLSASGGKIIVKSQVPIELQLLNPSNLHRAIGVTLEIDLG